MRCASIDIGTNTTLLLIIEAKSGMREILDISQSPRLGQDLDKNGILTEEAIERTISSLRSYKEIIEREKVEKVFVFGTCALREAENSDHFVKLVRERLGFETEILSWEKEAYYSFLSVLMDPEINYDGELIVDIGGGSTEIIYTSERKLQRMVSLPLGAVRLKENFLKNDPPEADEISLLVKHMEDVLEKKVRKEKADMVGIGGTVTSLAAILSGRDHFQKEAINGMKIQREEVARILNKMKGMTCERIKKEFPPLEAGRADIILCGIILLLKIMDFFESSHMKVSTKGARYGIIYERLIKVQ